MPLEGDRKTKNGVIPRFDEILKATKGNKPESQRTRKPGLIERDDSLEMKTQARTLPKGFVSPLHLEDKDG